MTAAEPKSGLLKSAVFGSADGLNAGLAVVFGQPHLLLAFALLISVEGALSMAAGEFVSALTDNERSFKQEWPVTVVMGLFVFAGTVAPMLPPLLGGVSSLTRLLAVAVGLLLALVVGYVGARDARVPWHSYAISLGSFAVVIVPTVLIALALGIG